MSGASINTGPLQVVRPSCGTAVGVDRTTLIFSLMSRTISRSAVDHFRVAYRDGDLKLIARVNPDYRNIESYEVYDLSADPEEHADLAGNKTLAEPLMQALNLHLQGLERKDSSDDPVLSAEEQEQLRAIGYGDSSE